MKDGLSKSLWYAAGSQKRMGALHKSIRAAKASNV